MLWLLMAVLTALAALAMLVPLFRREPAEAGASASAIYRDQLATLGAEAARGVIPAEEAESARTEIARRLIRAEAAEPRQGAATTPLRLKAAAALALAVLPLGSLALYHQLGSPALPDAPLQARLSGPARPDDIAALVARVESHLAEQPNDGQGWALIAPVYTRLGRLEDAAKAYGNALRLLPVTADRHIAFGEALLRLRDGGFSPEAMKAFEEALKLDPKSIRGRFYWAMGLGQAGRTPEAIEAWNALLKEAPPAGAPWADAGRAELARLTRTAPRAGPGEAEVAAASNMAPADRQAMIAGMVDSLATRLRDNPNDAEGWTTLIRSYSVLGRTDDAKAALAKARETFATDREKLAALDGLALSLKLE